VEYLEFARLNKKSDSVSLIMLNYFLPMKRVIPQREKLKTLGSEFQEGTGAISAELNSKIRYIR